jgi:hypothetical protein
MSIDRPPPDFATFTRWLASKGRNVGAPNDARHYNKLWAAARVARDCALLTTDGGQTAADSERQGQLEVLQLLAAADRSGKSRPPELVTGRGFRVTLAYEDGPGPEAASICVLVRSPPELIERVQGKSAFLWNGAERFELGQFDSEGKAIGTLPVGVEISLSDFATGRVKLEQPPSTFDE